VNAMIGDLRRKIAYIEVNPFLCLIILNSYLEYLSLILGFHFSLIQNKVLIFLFSID
jgi:hypothetical protein